MTSNRGAVFVVKFLHGDQEKVERAQTRVAEIRARAGMYDGPGSVGGRPLFVEWHAPASGLVDGSHQEWS